MASLGLATLAAIVAFFLLRFWGPEEEAVHRGRRLTDVEFTYVCARHHTLRLWGRVATPRCYCGLPTYVRASFRCEIHGAFDAELQFGEDERGVIKVSELRLPGKSWTSVDQPLPCPRCRRPMTRQPSDPLDARRARDDRTTG